MKANIETTEPIHIDDSKAFEEMLGKIKQALFFVVSLKGYKYQKKYNTIFILLAVGVLFFMSPLIMPKSASIILLVIFRLAQAISVHMRMKGVIKEWEGTTTKDDLKTKFGGVGGLLTILAMIGIMFSFTLPLITVGNISMDYAEIGDKFNSLNSGASAYMGGVSIGKHFLYFMFYSFLSALSIVLGYIKRKTIWSLIGLLGIFFYARVILTVFFDSDGASNVFYILKNLHNYGIISGDDIGNAVLSSPGFFLYVISSFFLLIACFMIIKGYIALYSEKVG